MAAKWVRKGLVFEADNRFAWMRTHAAVPFGELIGERVLRCYFNCRDERQRARIGRLDFDLAREEVAELHPLPVLDLGPLGAYDDHGVVGSWLVNHDDRKYLYFSGMTLGITVPFYFYLGLAVSDDGGRSFRRFSPAPILERDPVDPYLTGQVCVLRDGGVWRMWYVSGDRWERDSAGEVKHFYNIKYAESVDGVRWRRQGVVCIDFRDGEHSIARPSVVKDGDLYRMWYCYRGSSYRIGYAESGDGLSWERKDSEAGIEPSTDGWDSEMLAYPFVLDAGGSRHMFYNGNGYGESGLGWAVLDAEDAGDTASTERSRR